MPDRTDSDNLIASGDPSQFKPCFVQHEHGRRTKQDGDWPPHWNIEWPNETVNASAFVPKEDVDGSKAIGFRNLEGPRGLVCTQAPIKLSAGKTYLLKFEYLTPHGSGALRLEAPDSSRFAAQSFDIGLADTGGKWKPVEVRLQPKADAEYKLSLECYSSGPDQPLYFKSLSLRPQ